jgi:CHAT domain-containing protein
MLGRALAILFLAALLPDFVRAQAAALNPRTDGVIDRMETAGRYLELRDYVQRRIAEGAAEDATALGYLCIAYGKLKQYAPLFDCLAKLERRIEQGDARVRFLNTLRYDNTGAALPILEGLRAEALLDFGDYRAALAAAEKGYAAVPPLRSWLDSPVFPPVKLKLTLLPIMAIASVQAGDTDKAKRLVAEIEAVSMPTGGSGMWEAMRSNALGRAHMALGNYERAIGELSGVRRFSFVGALADLAPGYGGKDNSFLTTSELPRRLMLAKAYAETGKLGDAKSALDEVLASARAREMGDLHWLALYERGRIAEAEKDLPAAEKLLASSIAVIEQQRTTINTEASKIGFAGDKQAAYARLIEVLLAQGKVEAAFDYVERSKSRALVDMLAAKKDFASPATDPDKARLVLAQFDAAAAAARLQDISEEISATRARTLQVAQQQLQSTAPDLASLVTVTAASLDELKSLLNENEVLVEYYYQGAALYAFALDRARLQVLKLDGTGLDAQVRDLRSSLQEISSASWQAMAQSLYERLWKPLEPVLGKRNVVVVAHGALHYLPFAALRSSDGRFLIDGYSVRLLPSASVLKFLRPALQAKQAHLLALGNPDLGDPAQDLRFAEAEARTVAQFYPDSRLLVRRDASETNLRQAAGVFARLHFAMHGKFQADNPLASGLYLAKDAENDGVLTVGELYSMNLDADLVTLSACETGLGKVASGDDVVGLTRGFLYAGSRSIVASLWSVDDNATAELMKIFYRNLGTMNKQESLRQAQIAARQAFPHPFFWAAFQLTGRAD